MNETSDNGAAEVLCDVRNHTAWVTLNRPTALNALSFSIIGRLRTFLERCADDPDVRAVLLCGAGDKAFCAGGDLRALYQSFKESGSLHDEFFAAEYALDYMLYGYPKPYIAVMDGITMGGGMGLAQGSALRIVGERTRIAMPEVGIGLFPDVGASYFLSRLPGALGAYLALTGVQIRGADALYSRLADVYLPPAAVAGLRETFSALEWTAAWAGDVRTKIHSLAAEGLPAPSLSVLRSAIDEHFSKSSVAGILDSLDAESRPAMTEWAAQTAKVLRGRSPTMLTVTLRQLKVGATLELSAAFRMELSMVKQCFAQGDFIEGIRALIIDKDNTPHWNPDRIDKVNGATVDAFFRDRWSGAIHPLANLGAPR